MNRRQFLGKVVLGGVAAALAPVLAKATPAPASIVIPPECLVMQQDIVLSQASRLATCYAEGMERECLSLIAGIAAE